MLIGLVGKPSSGKSTLFNALTLLDVPMASYPFTTIEPNRGVGFVRVECVDRELGVQCMPRTGRCENGIRFVPVELMDVAGLVPGASEGRGRGNAFLNDLSRASVLVHVVDASGSTNEEGEAVPPGSHDPCKDVRFLETEIDLWYFGVLEKNWGKFGRVPVSGKQELLRLLMQSLAGLGVKESHVETALKGANLLEKRLPDWTPADKQLFSVLLRRASKPIVVAANKMDLPSSNENIGRLGKAFPDVTIVPCSGIAELTLKRAAKAGGIHYVPGEKDFAEKGPLSEGQKKGLEFLRANVLQKFGSTGCQDLLDKTVFEALGYIAVFPGGVKKLGDSEGRILPDVFLLPRGSTALDFAFTIHTDLGEGFIRAIDVRTKKMVGKEHELKNRDVIEIVSAK